MSWTDLSARAHELKTLESLTGLLHWDQQVMMPPGGATVRGDQLSLLSRLHHERLCDPALADAVALAAASDDPLHQAAARNLGREIKRAVKVPGGLVERISRAQTESVQAWVQAKNEDRWEGFEPKLAALVALVREKADLLADGGEPFDALLEAHDPGSTAATLDPMFERLEAGTKDFLARIEGAEAPPALEGTFDVAGQKRLHRRVAEAIGYDFDRGRLDEAEHPFTVGMHPRDTRLTTHYYPDDLLSGLGGTVHEAGHGMYEQGLPVDFWGVGVGNAASFGLHESQSRFWENQIGRSLPFFTWLAPMIQEELGLRITPEQLFAGANRVQRSLIRVFADEVTYNLHIIVRYRLERQLFAGTLEVQDLPEAWNEGMRTALGITPPTLAQGVLQDVHWGSGYFGYFPSYTLGNLYSAGLSVAMERDLPDMWTQVEAGQFGAILGWLRERVHSQAHLRDAPAIVDAACGGERDLVADLLQHFETRQGALYL